MRYSRYYDSLVPIYRLIGSNTFTSHDLPAVYRKRLRGLECNGYLVKLGKIQIRFDDGIFYWVPQWRISEKFLKMLDETTV